MIPTHFISKWSKPELKERSTIVYKGKRKNLGVDYVSEAADKSFETFPFAKEMRKAEKKMNRDEGDGGDEKRTRTSSPLSPPSPSSLLNHLFSLSAILNLERAGASAGKYGETH